MFHFFTLVLFDNEVSSVIEEESLFDITTFKLRIKTINIKPTTNSNPPKPKIKNVIDVEVISLIIEPTVLERTNKTNHVNSANNNIVIKLLILKKNKPKHNQKKIIKKSIQPNI